MRSITRFRLLVLATTVTTTMIALLAQAGTLEPKTTAPIYSYLEGLRGRLPLWTSATPDDPTAVWINPAILGTGKAKGLVYVHTYVGDRLSGDDAFALSLGSIAFGAELTEFTYRSSAGNVTEYETNRYTFGLGTRLTKGLYVGTSYSWHSSEICDLDRAATWSAGVLFRPHRTLSLGITGRELNQPIISGTELKPMVEAALGVRPMGERLTVFCNLLAREEQMTSETFAEQPKSFLSYGLEIVPLDGIVVRAGSDEAENLSASFMLHIGPAGYGSTVTQKKGKHGEDDETYGTIVIKGEPFWHRSVLNPEKNYIEIDLRGRIGEARSRFSIFGGGPRYTLRSLLDRIEYAQSSPEIKAIVLRCGDMSANFAIYDELRQALIDFRQSGKKVIAYLENPGNGAYYLATASDYIALTPNGYIGLVGLKSEMLFLKGTLEKLGIEAKYVRVGKYKSAVEPLSQDRYTEPSREAVNALLDDIFETMVNGIASGRGFTQSEVKDLIDNGPYIPSEAVRENLIDTLAYWDEIPDIVEDVTGGKVKRLSYDEFARRRPASLRWDEPPRIGIIYGVGGITHGRNRRDLLVGDIMGSETITEAFKQLREDGAVKAVIFRVDSPGGMMTASDKIRREVELTAGKKPVIISMGGVAASGGYHVSCDGTKILADQATVTGSIGVLNLWLHTRGFYEKIGANKEIFLRGKYADFYTAWRDITDEDMQRHQHYVDRYYDKFVADVSRGRSMGIDEVHEIAQGRVWSGKRAEELGLVDGIGGIKEAMRLAKREAGIPEDRPVAFEVLPRPGGLLDALMSSATAGVTGQIRVPHYLTETLEGSAYLETFDEPILYLMPYRIEID
jgi:protease-4